MELTANQKLVHQMYIAYYQRPADPQGLKYWVDQLETYQDWTVISAAFGSPENAENQALYGSKSREEVIAEIYQSAFDRAAVAEEISYWADSEHSLTNLAFAIINGAQNDDLAAVNAKVAFSQELIEQVDPAGNGLPAEYEIPFTSLDVVNMLKDVNKDTDVTPEYVEEAVAAQLNPNSVFTLTEIRTELPDTIPTQMVTYWGNPETGEGVPVQELLDIVSGYLSEDIKADLFDMGDILEDLKLITEIGINDMMQGGGPGDQFNGDAATGGDDADTGYDTGKEGDYTGNYQIRVELSDGTINEAIVTLTQEQFEFLNGLMFDADGNSRLYEQEVAYQIQARNADGNLMFADVLNDQGQTVQEPILVDAVVDGGYIEYPIILTPTQNNGGTEEIGKTSAADDFIVAARLELLHGAYIDGGEGENTLEIDAKGHFAQPKELLNIQHVKVENLPNVYTLDANGDNVNDYPDVQETQNGDADSIIDLSRAIDIETLTVTEGNFEGLDGQAIAGDLTLTGIRNGVTTTLDGGFSQEVTLNYGDMSDADGVNLVFHNLSMGDSDTEGANAQLSVAHNTETLNVEATGAGNYLSNGFLGGELSTLNITGDAHLYIEGNLESSFHAETPATIDASGNTGGVNLTLIGSDTNANSPQNVTFLGSTGDDIFHVDTTEAAGGAVNDGSDESVTIVSTAGNNHYEVVTDLATITDGDGNNSIEAQVETANITLGEGNNDLHVEATESVAITALNGDNTVEVMPFGADTTVAVSVELGDGDNTVSVSGSEIAVTTGAGNDSLTLVGTESTYVNEGALITINTGTGEDSLVLGQDDSESGAQNGIVAKVGSSITGENISLYVENVADLRAAELDGITSVLLNYDVIGVPPITAAPATAALTLTAEQFADIGAENFSVEGTPFYTAGILKLIVTESTSLTDLGVDALPANLDLQLVLEDGVVLEMTAEQLHTRVAEEGVTLAADGNIDDEPGSVYITDAGNDFDAYGTGIGGTLHEDVGSRIDHGDYERPDQDGEFLSRWVHDSDTDGAEIVADQSNANLLRLIGDSDLTMTTVEGGIDDWGRVTDEALAIELNVDGAAATPADGGFFVDFSALNGQLIDMTLARFEDVEAVYGNGLDARLNVQLTGDLGSKEKGLVSRDVQTYVVTDIETDASVNTDEVDFFTCETTQDLETLGLQGNYTKTVNFMNTELNVDFLMEVAYSKGNGYSVGTLMGQYAREGADAVVNVVGLDALPEGEVQKVAGIELENADTAEINVTGGDTVIESLVGEDVTTFTFTADADLTVETSFITATTEVVDGTAVAGDFNITVAAPVAPATVTDLSEVDLLGIDQIVLKNGANLTLSAQQLVDLADKIVQEDNATTNLNVVELSTEALDLGAIDVDTIGTVTFADVDGTIVAEVANFGDAASVTILAEENDTAVEMTAEQFATITDGTVNVDEDNGNDATLVLTDLANDETLNLDNVDEDAVVVLRVEDLVATADMVIEEDGEVDSITLEVVGTVDLTAAELGVDASSPADGDYLDAGDSFTIDAVNLGENATLTLTAAQVAAIGTADTDNDGVADAWAGLAGSTLNVTDLSTQELDLDAIAQAGINIGTVTIENTNTDFVIDPATTFGGADAIVTPTADAGAPEWGTEQTQVTMTVDQFLSSAGIITGDSQINLTGLYNNVDTDGDFIPDAANFDLSGIANAGTITFANDTVNYADADPQTIQHVVTLHADASLGGFTIALGNGDLIRFATEAQAAATITANSGDITGVQWLWTEFGAEVDTSGYDEDIATLFIDEALLVSQTREEDLWSTLHGSITVEKINGDTIPELIKYNRVNTFEAFTNIGAGINYDDSADFGTLANLTMNLEGEVNLGNILLGDTNNGDGTPESNNINGVGFFQKLVINSYLDLSNNPELSNQDPETSGRVIEANYLGDISLNAGSVDQLVSVTINTYGDGTTAGTGNPDDQYEDADNVSDANSTSELRDGLAIETGTITFAADEAGTTATLTLTGAEDATIAGVDISDANVDVLHIDMWDESTTASAFDGALTVGGVEYTNFDIDGTGNNNLDMDNVYLLDGYTDDDTFGTANSNDLIEVVKGTVDLTEATLTNVDAFHVSGDATITMTAEQIATFIGEENFTLATGANVTINVTEVNGNEIDLDILEAAGFNIGTVSVVADGVTLHADTTLGGADSLIVATDDNGADDGVEMTASQYLGFSGVITESGSGSAYVTITDLVDASNRVDIPNPNDDDRWSVNLDLTTVATTGTHTLEVADANAAADVTIDSASDLSDFIIQLDDVNSDVNTPNQLAGQTIRFTTEEQAGRQVIVVNADNDAVNDPVAPVAPVASEKEEKDTNVVWEFDSITGPVDTSLYDPELGRLWISDELVQSNNDLEDLFGADAAVTADADGLLNNVNLNGNIIVRIVNTQNLGMIDYTSNGVDRTVEIEAYTDLSGTGLVFDEQDTLVDVRNLTIDLGGEVELGDLVIDNIIQTTKTDLDSDQFEELIINSYLASTQGHYLLPEDFVHGTNVYPIGANVIGNISAPGIAPNTRGELTDVTVNAAGVGIVINEIRFSEEDTAGAPAKFTAAGGFDITVKSLDTSDAGVTSLTVDNNMTAGTLLVTGGSPAFNGGATGNTETLSVTTSDSDAVTTFGSADDSDGVGVYAGVYGPELSSITVDGSGTTNLGTLADIDGTIDATDSPNGFTFTVLGAGTVTATLGEANVDNDDIAPAIEAGEAWTFDFGANGNGSQDSALTVESKVEFNGGVVEFDMGNADLIVDGDVDMQALTGLTYSGSGNVVLTTDATLQLTDEQWLNSGFKAAFDANRFVDENGDPTVLTVDADFVAEFGSDLTHVFGYAEYNIESGVTVTLREDQADAAYVDGDDQNPGDLTGATVTVFVQEMVDTSDPLDGIGDDDVFGDNDITNLVGVDALVIEADTTDSTIDTPDVIQTFGYSVTMTVEQADSLVGNITKNGNTVIALAGEDPDAGKLKDLSGLDLTEVDTLTLEDADGTILTVAQYAALGGANINKGGNTLSLIGAGDQTALDMTDGGDPANQVVDALILNGNMTITATQGAELTGITMENPADTHSLTITDVSGLGADILPAPNGDGFPDANSTLTLDLLNVTVDSVTAELHTNTKDPADGVTDIDGNFTLAGDLNGATLELTGTGTLTSDVTVVDGATVTNVTDTVTVNLTDTTVALNDPDTDPASDDSIDLSGIEAAIAGTLTLSGNTVLDPLTDLGAFDVVMGIHNLTATGAQINGATVTSTTGNLTLNGVTTAHDLSNLTIGGNLTINVEDAASFDINAVQADGATINDVAEVPTDVALDQVNVLEFENALGADLSQLDATNDGFAIDVQLASTGGVEIGATANLSTIHDGANNINGEAGDSQVTISGTGVVTVAQGANVASTDFIVGAGSTLTADQSLTGVSLITEAGDANVSGAGTLLYTGMDSASITLEQDVRISVVELSAGDASVDINGFQAGTFVWDAVALELGAHRLDFTSFITTPMTYTDVATGLGDETGNAHDIFSFSIGALAGSTAATVETAFADDGTFDGVDADSDAVTFATNAELIFLIGDGTETGIWHYQDGIGGTADGIVEQGELSLIGVVDLQHTAHANLVDQNFILV